MCAKNGNFVPVITSDYNVLHVAATAQNKAWNLYFIQKM